jgi:hypothetical protein
MKVSELITILQMVKDKDQEVYIATKNDQTYHDVALLQPIDTVEQGEKYYNEFFKSEVLMDRSVTEDLGGVTPVLYLDVR